MQAIIRVASWLVLFPLSTSALGEVARFALEAKVASVEVPPGHAVHGRLAVGDTIRGVLQYDLGLGDSLEHRGDVGSYEALPAGENRFRAQGGHGFVFDSSLSPRPFFVATVDDAPQFDALLVNMSGDTLPSTLERADTQFVEMGLLLQTANTRRFASDSLPRSLSHEAFELAGLDFFGAGDTFPTFLVQTTITALETIPPLSPGDFDASGRVEQGDLDLVLLGWGSPAALAGDAWRGPFPSGDIDQDEFDGVLLHWGNSDVSAAAVPEPNAIGSAIAIGTAIVCWISIKGRRCSPATATP
jgi:hypothetical protein